MRSVTHDYFLISWHGGWRMTLDYWIWSLVLTYFDFKWNLGFLTEFWRIYTCLLYTWHVEPIVWSVYGASIFLSTKWFLLTIIMGRTHQCWTTRLFYVCWYVGWCYAVVMCFNGRIVLLHVPAGYSFLFVYGDILCWGGLALCSRPRYPAIQLTF